MRSRSWFLRSSASGAFDSARVWFWQTRQRSSSASSITRFSRTGSAAAGAASLAAACATSSAATSAASSRAAILGTLELSDERQQGVLHDLRCEGADALVANHALLVDQVGLGHAVDAVVDADTAVEVEDRDLVGVAHALQPGESVRALVLVVESVDGHGAARGEIEQHRVLLAARDAPRRPDVEHPDLAQHVALAERLVRFVQPRQLEVRRGLADEWRGHLARVELEADAQQDDKHYEYSDGDDEAVHRAAATAYCSGARRAARR